MAGVNKSPLWPALHERETILRDRNNFGPRFSVAFSPLDSGKLVLRFGSGSFQSCFVEDDRRFHARAATTLLRYECAPDPTGRLMTAEQRRVHRRKRSLSGDHGLGGDLRLNHEFYGDSIRGYEFRRVIRSTLVWNAISGAVCDRSEFQPRGIHLWREFNAKCKRWAANFSEFLTSRDFANSVDPVTGVRPLHNTSTAGELVRFVLGSAQQAGVSRVVSLVFRSRLLT